RAAPAAPARPQIIVVTTAMLVFISFWRAAAIVLCDMASTVYYIGGIVEQAIGKAAPWYIGAVMLFAYAVRGVYIESCAMFVRGGVYRVVKEAMGGTLAKLSVSALMVVYVLTGPISGEAAGGRGGTGWRMRIGARGTLLPLGRSIRALSGEEALQQANREVAHPKVPNLIRAGFIIFLFSMPPPGLISFFAVLIIPDDV